MDETKFQLVMEELLAEYEKSGKSMDDFIQEKLTAAGRKDAAEYAKEISATLETIDQKFTGLQKYKAEGGNREEWLRREVDRAAADFSPDEVGKVLSSTVKVMQGDEAALPDENASYSALDAAFLIRDLDDALVSNVCANLGGKEEEK